MTIMECIVQYVDGQEDRVPIFTNDIYKYVEKNVPDIQKGVLNEYIVRYAKVNPNFIRYQKGIYYKTVKTPFGQAGIKYAELIKRVYIGDGEEIIGYETGPSYMNKIGLTTQISAHTYLATERQRATFSIEDTNLYFIKPVTGINKDNYRYLQFLDILENKMKVKIETENYKDILRNYIDKHLLNFEKLLAYARYYKNNNIYKGIAELARG